MRELRPLVRGIEWVLLVLLVGVLGWCGRLGAWEFAPGFEFTGGEALAGWQAQHDVGPLEATPEGMRLEIQGADPYFSGPVCEYPEARPLWLQLRVWSERGGTLQVFYYRDAPTEEASVRGVVEAGLWQAVRLPLPPLAAGMRLRIDPPGGDGRFILARIGLAERVTPGLPVWPQPGSSGRAIQTVELEAGELRLSQGTERLGAIRLTVAGRDMAVGYPEAMIGYQYGGQVRWFPFEAGELSVRRHGDAVQGRWVATDRDGARWTWEQWWVVADAGRIDLSVRIEVEAEREVVFLPALLLFPGVGSFSTNKHQALFAGVEYLANEPSSSEADLRGPAARRLVPDRRKLTLPLMVVEHGGCYVAVAWEPQPGLAAVFDSPDRQFGSSGHVLGLVAPGSDGSNRDEGSLLPYEGLRLRPGQPLAIRASLLGGRGDSVVPAIQQYLGKQGWPDLPNPGMTERAYYELAGRGWLDSRIRQGARFYHAWWPGFSAGPAADAAMWMDWTATALGEGALADRLRAVAGRALQEVPPGASNDAAVGHVRYPVAALLYGEVEAAVARSQGQAEAMLGRFTGEGVVPYRKAEGKPDYAATHWKSDANGLTAGVVARLLEAAAFAGDRALQEAGVRHLRALLERERKTVPRGAQTWEIPLHTPDILASAHLTLACVFGYLLTGDEGLLDEAEYWAWTGVPFVYLVPPTDREVGLYSTIAVLGATGWEAPVWLGQPVQWCGLVYADAVRRLGRYRPEGPWNRLANGIALAGVQHTWPETDAERMGLLPDYFLLEAQRRDGPAINPATVQSQAIRAFGRAAVYDFVVAGPRRLHVHAGGQVTIQFGGDEELRFRVDGWRGPSSWVLVHGCENRPRVEVNGQVPGEDAVRFDRGAGWLMFKVPSQAEVRLDFSEGWVAP